ncbi:MAG: hypothetical protein A2161_04525 [Candidatus Schekmanbacteria bacterium RBG_13_48_7]|uniref:Formyl transferase N-terminal domain-containing protein n=1 Tax=Candidatus Schekmanbacteria bacterium RBG_13_48_7 TaxID=1817878 RepID=A0A1F7RUS3_9BACT|nr:MAG: hypothetical protein A2161_04525 [Candidatus Schekmanbacteria bacterium RBG_13_48_7]
MKVLLLGPVGSPLVSIIRDSYCEPIEFEDKIDKQFLVNRTIDFVVSYRYRHILAKDIIDYLNGKIINLHISFLPWNRGSDPNLWSFLEDTPKGVTIHHIDEGIDTGDIIAQKQLYFDPEIDTLTTSYLTLNKEIVSLFNQYWPRIMCGESQRHKQHNSGSFHRTKDKKEFEFLLKNTGWNTPVRELIGKALLNCKKHE